MAHVTRIQRDDRVLEVMPHEGNVMLRMSSEFLVKPADYVYDVRLNGTVLQQVVEAHAKVFAGWLSKDDPWLPDIITNAVMSAVLRPDEHPAPQPPDVPGGHLPENPSRVVVNQEDNAFPAAADRIEQLERGITATKAAFWIGDERQELTAEECAYVARVPGGLAQIVANDRLRRRTADGVPFEDLKEWPWIVVDGKVWQTDEFDLRNWEVEATVAYEWVSTRKSAPVGEAFSTEIAVAAFDATRERGVDSGDTHPGGGSDVGERDAIGSIIDERERQVREEGCVVTHSPEPWTDETADFGRAIIASNDKIVEGYGCPMSDVDRARAVACVNACAGFDPEAVRELCVAVCERDRVAINSGVAFKRVQNAMCRLRDTWGTSTPVRISPLAEIVREDHGPFALHNFPCPVCCVRHAVFFLNNGVYGPCRECRKDQWRLRKRRWFDRLADWWSGYDE